MKILSCLLDNCREPDRQIGRKIGISGSAVRTRIKKMEKNGIIEKFTLKIEPPLLGYGLFYIVISGRNIDEIFDQVKLVGEPFLLAPCVGGITVCGIVVKENIENKINIAKNMMRDVRLLSIFEAEKPDLQTSLTKTDLTIVNELLKNPREKIENIARKTKLSTKTITRCINKLEKSNQVQFTVVYNPKKIRNFIPHAILTWVTSSTKTELNILEKKFSKYFMQKPFIAKNQIVLFMYTDDVYKLDDLTQKVRETEGIESADLFIPKKITFPQEWLDIAISNAQKSSRLHLMH